MLQYFLISFVVCLLVAGAVAAIAHRKSEEPGHAHWLGALLFALLAAAALTLLNLGR